MWRYGFMAACLAASYASYVLASEVQDTLAAPARMQRDQAMAAWEQCLTSNIQLQAEKAELEKKVAALEAKLKKEP